MSSLLKDLSAKLHAHQENVAFDLAFNYFNQSPQPYHELFDLLCAIARLDHPNAQLVPCLTQSFLQCRDESQHVCRVPTFDERILNDFILGKLPVTAVDDICEIFQYRKREILVLCRILLREWVNSPAFKRGLTIVVRFRYQLEFAPNEILLPLMVNSKEHLLQQFLDKRRDLEELILDVLERLYRNDGRKLWETLTYEFNMHVQNVNKKALGKLAVRYWNLIGHHQREKYPNLASLQHKRTLNYLVNLKYSTNGEEKTMSDEAWNEVIEDVLEGNEYLLEYLLDQLVNRNDVAAARYWISRLNRPIHTLPSWIQRQIRAEPASRPTTASPDQTRSQFYAIPLKETQIVFVNTMPGFERLMDRFLKVDNDQQEIYIGFDCEWKPMFKSTASAQQRVSIMQIAFPDEIFLLDMLFFFGDCDPQTVQKRLADQLFDDERVTVLCYGFRADASMLSSYSVFDRLLAAGKTLLDFSLVHVDLMTVQRDIFPYVRPAGTPSKDRGLSELVRLCFGKALDKSEQCSNWEKRPLRAPQVQYAAADAYCLLDVFHFLRDRVTSPEYLRSFRGQRPTKPVDQPNTGLIPE